MKILLANPRGFCAGVNMAIDVVDQVLKLKGPPVYVFHEIVHNRHVVDGFRERGVTFVDSMSEVPSGGLVVSSARIGVSPTKIRQESKGRGLIEVDATCPLVTKVHLEVLRFAKDGYQILFIGHRKHDEAVGTVGEAPDHITVVESPEEVANLNRERSEQAGGCNADYIEHFRRIADHFGSQGAIPQRQGAAQGRHLLCHHQPPKCGRRAWERSRSGSGWLGSKNSSNSLRLVERAHEMGKAAHLIDDQSGIDPNWFGRRRNRDGDSRACALWNTWCRLLIDRLKLRDYGHVELSDGDSGRRVI